MRSRKSIEQKIRTRLNLTLDPPLRDQLLARAWREQEQSQEPESALRGPVIRRMIMKDSLVKLGIAATILIAVSVTLSQFGHSLESVAWADVAEHFDSVPFFHLTMYIGHETSPETKKIEIWKSEGSRLRAQEGNKVFFADFTRKDRQVVVFDEATKKPVEGGGNAPGFLAMLCKDGQFSLNTLTASFPEGVKGITPLTAADTAASRETVLFEAKHESTPERLTIWALRKSRLPIRMRFEDPRQQEFGDFFFDYSQKKDAEFFDPNVFTRP